MKPIIGITMGDPAGVGPEIIVKALNNPDVYSKCKPIVVGDKQVMLGALNITGIRLDIQSVFEPAKAEYEHGRINIYDLQNINTADIAHVGERHKLLL